MKQFFKHCFDVFTSLLPYDYEYRFLQSGNHSKNTYNCSYNLLKLSLTHLGPLLCILFINDVADNVETAQILIFADDVKIFSVVNSEQGQIDLQINLNTFAECSAISKLKLNCDKCKLLSFGRNIVNKWL